MTTASPFGGSNQSITLEWNKVITISKKTVRFSKNVYQTHNIAAFGEGYVDIGTIPWGIIIVVAILGLIMASFARGEGWLLVLAAIGGATWNFVKPKHYGFLITLNSGDKKLFITTDKEGIQKVISVIYDLIEAKKEATYEISINHSQIKGNFIQGYLGGDASFNSD
jgi:hypothetical protein